METVMEMAARPETETAMVVEMVTVTAMGTATATEAPPPPSRYLALNRVERSFRSCSKAVFETT